MLSSLASKSAGWVEPPFIVFDMLEKCLDSRSLYANLIALQQHNCCSQR